MRLDHRKVANAVGIVESINRSKTSKVLGTKNARSAEKVSLKKNLWVLGSESHHSRFFRTIPVKRKTVPVSFGLCRSKGEKVIDLYSGIGSITLALARDADEAVGVELVTAGVGDAPVYARLNGIDNVRFKALDAGDAFKQEKTPPEVLVVDPPRKGMDKKVIEDVLQFGPERVVYVSCNPDTLARDIGLLKGRYKFIEATPVDMFPQTTHVETVVSMSRL